MAICPSICHFICLSVLRNKLCGTKFSYSFIATVFKLSHHVIYDISVIKLFTFYYHQVKYVEDTIFFLIDEMAAMLVTKTEWEIVVKFCDKL